MSTARMPNSRIVRRHDEAEWKFAVKLIFATLVILFLSLQFKLWFGDGNLQEVWQLQESIQSQKLSNAQLRHRNDALEAEVDDLKKGLDAIEERARKELGMVKKGETFYQIVAQPDAAYEGGNNDSYNESYNEANNARNNETQDP